MSISNHRPWAFGLLTAAALLLAACASPPDMRTDDNDVAGRSPEQFPQESPADSGYDPLAPSEDGATPLLLPMRDAVERGDWLDAMLATPSLDPVDLDAETRAWLRYLQARIDYLRGDVASAEATLALLRRESLTPGLERDLLLWRLEQAESGGAHQRAADLAHALLLAGGHPRLSAIKCEERLWFAVQAVDTPAGKPSWQSWWNLAAAARIVRGRDAAAALGNWLDANPRHPARDRAVTLQIAAIADDTLIRPALLIPQSGPLARAGEAVTGGLVAAFYAQQGGPGALTMVDSRRYENIETAYVVARERSADAVIGPLGKLQVAELLNSAVVDVPLLTLNRPEGTVTNYSDSLQLSLAPEDEANLLARRAFADGGRRALLIRPEGEWGERMEQALLAPWRQSGGQLVSRAVFGRPSTHSTVLQAALNLDASNRRSAELRRLFSEPLETNGERRRDLDVIFLLVRNADDARSLKPLINYHYAGDLPVYAVSTADDGSDAGANRDLEGIRLPVMPWRLRNAPPGMTTVGNGDAFAALHALGADAWDLIQRAQRLASGAGLRHAGYTAIFDVAADGTLRRVLPMAEFDRGDLVDR